MAKGVKMSEDKKQIDKCEICHTELHDEDDTHCERCMLVMGGGGAAHYMAEQIRKARKEKK